MDIMKGENKMMFKFKNKKYRWTCPTWFAIIGMIVGTMIMWSEHPFGL